MFCNSQVYHRFRGNIIEICKYLHNENVFMLMKKFEEPSSKSKSISVFSQHSFYTNTLIHYTFKKKKSYLSIVHLAYLNSTEHYQGLSWILFFFRQIEKKKEPKFESTLEPLHKIINGILISLKIYVT
ncbi:hypothetical protein GQR58_024460 [Nymphon striatum]|nr:hypothetical protein GQR58_024460 [Nymphon striatum]